MTSPDLEKMQPRCNNVEILPITCPHVQEDYVARCEAFHAACGLPEHKASGGAVQKVCWLALSDLLPLYITGRVFRMAW